MTRSQSRPPVMRGNSTMSTSSSSHNHMMASERNYWPSEQEYEQGKKGHSFLHILSITIGVTSFLFRMLLFGKGLGVKTGLIRGDNSSESFAETFYVDKYKLEVTPADWTFYLTAVCYMWQFLWMAYGMYTVCRTTEDGYMYRVFPVLPPILYVVFSFALACNISWLLIWDREYMEVALVFINLMTCNLYICLVVSLRRLSELGTSMARENLMSHVWLIRILVHNGLAMFATWGTVASMFNFAVVLTYRTGAKLEVGSAVSIAIFSLEIIVWWIFENCVFEKALRYLFTPYIVVLVSVAGIIAKNWDANSPVSVYTVILFCTVGFFTVMKLTLSVYRHYKYPMFDCRARYRVPDVFVESRNWCETQA